jgi:hypothetical protein
MARKQQFLYTVKVDTEIEGGTGTVFGIGDEKKFNDRQEELRQRGKEFGTSMELRKDL